jgi:hypothetical protein
MSDEKFTTATVYSYSGGRPFIRKKRTKGTGDVAPKKRLAVTSITDELLVSPDAGIQLLEKGTSGHGEVVYRGRPAKGHVQIESPPVFPKKGCGSCLPHGYVGGLSLWDQATNAAYEWYYTTFY